MSSPVSAPKSKRRFRRSWRYAAVAVTLTAGLVAGIHQASAADNDAKALAAAFAAHGVEFGVTVTDSHLAEPAYTQIAGSAAIVTPENEMKFGAIQGGGRDSYDFAAADRIVDFARAHGEQVHGHALAWKQQNAQWALDAHLSRDEAITALQDYVRTVVGHFKGRVQYWDAVNELYDYQGNVDTATDGPGKGNPWYRMIGIDYVDIVFQTAHAADPSAKLCYNDDQNGDRPEVYALVQGLVARGVPIDCVGLQGHYGLWGTTTTAAALTAKLNRFGAMGLQTLISEADVGIDGTVTDQKQQEAVTTWRNLVRGCLDAPSCKAFNVWGVTDKYSWIPLYFPPWGSALLWDDAYQAKPQLQAVLDEASAGTPAPSTSASSTPDPSTPASSTPDPSTPAATTPAATTPAAGTAGPIAAVDGTCVDVRNGDSSDGTVVQLYGCNGTPAQSWTVGADSTLRAYGKCLDVRGDKPGPGSAAQIAACTGGEAQRWTTGTGGSLRHPASGLCLAPDQGNTAWETPLLILPCDGSLGQKFTPAT